MAVRLGTVAPIGFDTIPVTSWLEHMRELGCEVVQVYRNAQADVSLRQMRDVVAQSHMPCDSLHAIFGEQYDPSNPGESARQFAVDTYKREGDLCLELGGNLVVVHCSTIAADPPTDDQRSARVRQLRQSAIELGEHGSAVGVIYAFENLPAFHIIGSDMPELVDIVSPGGSHAGICFDTGHANMSGEAGAMLAQTRSLLRYVHLNDNHGTDDDHLMPFEGTLDVEAISRCLCEIGYDGTLMLEVFYDVPRLQRLIETGFSARLARLIDIANGDGVLRA